MIQQHSQGEETKVEFSPITLQSYLKQIGDPNLTDLQREKFLQEHLGRRVEWEGYVRQVGKGTDLPERAHIVSITPTLDFSTMNLVHCWFPSKFKADLLSLKEKQKVIISGILEEQEVLGPVLMNCELRKVMDAE
ncbi:MAG: hypothetical protein NTX52_08755 [Planctomycetota bacterium]|nr:hypothetical protein [Planctomycetota bacterium]